MIKKPNDNLSAIKRELLEKRLRGTGDHGLIIRQLKSNSAPLSFAQQRLWFAYLWNHKSTIYNRPTALRFQGPLNYDDLTKSLNLIIQRHHILHTVLHPHHGKPVQIVSPHKGITIPIEDLSHQKVNTLKSVSERCQVLIRKSFDLTISPMTRPYLFRLNSDDHIFLFITHHICFDHRSETIFIQELLTAYRAFQGKKIPDLPLLPIQFSDYACWQHEQKSNPQMKNHLKYWSRKLKGNLPVLELPTDNPRPGTQTYNGAEYPLRIPHELVRQLKKLSLDHNATLFMLLLAAFKVLLYRYTNEKDIIVGTPVAGRNHIQCENLIGVFINTLALRVRIQNNPSFLQFLDQVRNACIESYAHQDLPFEYLIEHIQPIRDMSRSPIFQVMFNFEKHQSKLPILPHLKVSIFNIQTDVALFDLSLEIRLSGKKADGLIYYNTDLFNRVTIKRLAIHYKALLSSIADRSGTRIDHLQMMSPLEKQKILYQWNRKKVTYPTKHCIHHLFEKNVARMPDKSAVIFQGTCLTYSDLNKQTNLLANKLLEAGLTPNTRVSIYVERNLEMIVALMGTLKAGGAYVPIDTAFPEKRINYIIQDSGSKVLVAQKSLIARIPPVQIPIIYIDDLGTPSGISENPRCNLSVYNLAYVIYTSGTTGKPKGVMITHQNVIALLYALRHMFSSNYSRISTSVATHSFDTSVEELFSPLCFGGTLHIIPLEKSPDVRYFADYLTKNRITVSYILPTFIPGIAQHLQTKTDRLHLKCILTGLEPKKQKVLQTMRNLSTKLHILNLYGPTEVTYGATAFDFQQEINPDLDVPIGMPFPNYQTYILDKTLEPVPIGVKGELYIGGTGIALGYLNQPKLTAEKFIPDPFGKHSGGRLFRTGDQVRYLPDGNLEFFGRLDNQLKIRGYRIEPGEIETHLHKHPKIHHALVLGREDTSGDKTLVSYVVSKTNNAPKPSELRRYLKKILPEYMIPSHYIILNELPLQPNGKVDRSRLPLPDNKRPDLDEPFVVPVSFEERKLVSIWEDILGIKNIGIHDNFFELGGHSLMAIQVISRIGETFNVLPPLRLIFGKPTIAELAKYLYKSKNGNTHDPLLQKIKPYKREKNRFPGSGDMNEKQKKSE